MDSYTRLLRKLQDHLLKHGVEDWPARFEQWIKEWNGLTPDQAKAHIARTQKALVGMGSVADIVICVEAGHKGVDDERSRQAANDKLMQLVDDVYEDVSRRLQATKS